MAVSMPTTTRTSDASRWTELTTPLIVNLLVLDDDSIRLRAVPLWSCIFDAKSWAKRLVHWHLDASWKSQADFPDVACWLRETAGEIENWLLDRRTIPSHPLLRARISLQPHTVGQRALRGYIDCVITLGQPVENDQIDVCLLLDRDGGAMFVSQTARLAHDFTSEAVDAEMVSAERMVAVVEPFLCYLSGRQGGSLCPK